MSSFSNLFNRIQTLTEAKVSPYTKAHPAFGGITKKMRAGGLSAAPLDTIKFIRETLYYMDILNDDELNAIKKAPGFSGKKQAMLAALQAKQDLINQNKDAIAARIEETLDNFISGVGVNRGREEKYAAQAAAEAIAKEVRKSKSGKELDDALTDVISDEALVITASLAKVLGEIRTHLGEEGFDIEDEALSQVEEYADKISTVEQLKSFIKQIQAEPGYEKIAAYLSSIVKPVEAGLEDEEMEDEEHDWRPESVEEYPVSETEYDEAMEHVGVEEVLANAEKLRNRRPELRRGQSIMIALHKLSPELYKRAVEVADAFNNDSKIPNLLSFISGNLNKGEDEEKKGKYDEAMKGKKVTFIKVPEIYRKALRTELEELGVPHEFGLGGVEVDEIDVNEVDDVLFSLRRSIGRIGDEEEKKGKYDDGDGKDEKCDYVPCEDSEEVVAESYTSQYLIEQTQKDKRNTAPKQETVSFKERMKPKNSWQLEELRRYGL